MVSVIVFDLDDTLYPEREYQLSGFKAVEAWLSNRRDAAGFHDVAARLFGEGVRGNVFNLALDEMRVSYNGDLIGQLIQVFREHQPAITLFEDAEWALQQVAQMKCRSGMITDGYRVTQANKVKALGLEARLDLIIFTDELGRDRWKPHPLAYQMVMENFGCSPSDCVYIADNPTKDFIAANEQGWSTVRVRRKAGEHASVEASPGFEAAITVATMFDIKLLGGFS